MKKILFLLILFLTFYLRNYNLYTWPRLGATFDEYAWTWQGINLIQKHTPISWSPHPQYKNAKDIYYQTVHFRIVKPYLEHPPLFGLIAGSFALVSGSKDMYDVTIQKIRPLALVFGIISVILLYYLVSQLYGASLGLLASFLYAIIPSTVVGSRLIQNENFFIPGFLLTLIIIVKYLNSKNKLFLYLAGIICGLLILAKIPWIAATFTVLMILFYNKKYKESLIIIGFAILSFVIFALYGYHYDFNLFVSLWKLQLQRYDLTFNSVFALWQEPYLTDRFLTDGWIYFGWFASFLLLAKNLKKNYILIFALLGYFAVFIFAIPNEPGHGWYRYPFYPFLITSVALFIKEYFNKNYILTFLFLVLVGLSMLELSWGQAFGFSFLILRFALLFYGLSLLPIFLPNPKSIRIANIVNYISLVGIFILTIWSTLNYNEQ